MSRISKWRAPLATTPTVSRSNGAGSSRTLATGMRPRCNTTWTWCGRCVRGIEPIVTLHHFTNPAWLAELGGWLRNDTVKRFADYAERVAERLAGEVRYWISINEPTVYAKHAFVTGAWPPGVRGSWRQALAVMRNMARAHVAVHTILHRHRPDAMVGFAHSAPLIMACNPQRPLDRAAALMRDVALNRLPFLLLGRSPRRCSISSVELLQPDCRALDAARAALLFGEDCLADHHGEPPLQRHGLGDLSRGLRLTLERFGDLWRAADDHRERDRDRRRRVAKLVSPAPSRSSETRSPAASRCWAICIGR